MLVPFHTVPIDSEFTLNGKRYTRIAKQKISCCTSVNAQLVETQQKIHIPTNTKVEVEDKDNEN